jgi:hypothetical protein
LLGGEPVQKLFTAELAEEHRGARGEKPPPMLRRAGLQAEKGIGLSN